MKAERGVDDAISILLNVICKHLKLTSSYVRILFVNFSSAINMIQSHILIEKLMKMGGNLSLLKWIYDFLTNREQYVMAGNCQSSLISISNLLMTLL